MKYRLALWIYLGILLISLASSYDSTPLNTVYLTKTVEVDTNMLDVIQQGTDYKFQASVYDSITGNLITDATCSVYVYNPVGEQIFNSSLTYDGTSDYYVSFNSSDLGKHSLRVYCAYGTGGAEERVFFDVTPSGDMLGSSNAGIIYIVIGIEILFALFFFGLGYRTNNLTWQIIFFGLSAIMLVVGLLYSLVVAEQIIPTQLVIIDGLATLWAVIKILLGVALVLLVLFVLINVYWSWNKKRGFTD